MALALHKFLIYCPKRNRHSFLFFKVHICMSRFLCLLQDWLLKFITMFIHMFLLQNCQSNTLGNFKTLIWLVSLYSSCSKVDHSEKVLPLNTILGHRASYTPAFMELLNVLDG